jgi:ribose transport system ATP-binding protein
LTRKGRAGSSPAVGTINLDEERLLDLIQKPFFRSQERTSKLRAYPSISPYFYVLVTYLSEDRKTEGLITAMTIRENLTLASLFRLFRFGTISQLKEREAARKWVRELRIIARSIEQTVATLSGGNQQRTVFAKWRATEPRLLLLDEPTRGIDVNAKSEIYKMIDEIAAQGLAVLMVSSELPELIGMSDASMR